MNCNYAYVLYLSACWILLDSASSFEWITPETQQVVSLDNTRAVFLWYFRADAPYTSFLVLHNGAIDILQVEPGTTISFNYGAVLSCGDHFDGMNDVYCVSVEIDADATSIGDFSIIVSIDGEQQRAAFAELNIINECPPLDEPNYTPNYDSKTIEVFFSGNGPPVMVVLFVEETNVLGACQISDTNRTCTLKAEEIFNNTNGTLSYHRCGETRPEPVDVNQEESAGLSDGAIYYILGSTAAVGAAAGGAYYAFSKRISDVDKDERNSQKIDLPMTTNSNCDQAELKQSGTEEKVETQ